MFLKCYSNRKSQEGGIIVIIISIMQPLVVTPDKDLEESRCINLS